MQSTLVTLPSDTVDVTSLPVILLQASIHYEHQVFVLTLQQHSLAPNF